MNVVPVQLFQWLSKTHSFGDSSKGEISQFNPARDMFSFLCDTHT